MNRSKITFIIPVKHPKYIKNRAKFEKLVKTTLQYCLRIPDSTTIVVGNPGSIFFDIPSSINQLIIEDIDFDYGDHDKGIKLQRGILQWFIKDLSDHVMPLDCDDLVLPNIQDVPKDPNQSYVLTKGYQQIFNKVFTYEENFNYHCGSSFIFCKKYFTDYSKKYSPLKPYLFHQDHDLSKFVRIPRTFVIQRCWHGENIWWKRMRLRDLAKWFVGKKYRVRNSTF